MSLVETHTTIAGYRLVRRIGSGSRADLFLAVPLASAGASRAVVLKLYRSDLDRSDVAREVEVLGRLDLPHCVRLLDLSSDDDARSIPILERIPRGSVARLLADREWLEAGEAVTILAPLPATIRAMHDRGVAHGRIAASSVHFGAAGEPVILGFGHASVFSPGLSMAALDTEAGAATDRDALALLAEVVLSRVRTPPPRVVETLDWIRRSAGDRRAEFPSELEGRLFASAEPLPVEFGSANLTGAAPARSTMPLRAIPVLPPASVVPATEDSSATTSPRDARGVATELVLAGPGPLLRAAASTARRLSGGVRPRFWVMIGVVFVALVTALLVPPLIAPAHVTTPRAAVTFDQSPTPATASGAAGTGASAAGTVPADPLKAAGTLIRARDACVREMSILCLDAVDEDGASALASDAALIRRIRSGQQVPAGAAIRVSTPTLTERLGDSALIALDSGTDAQSVLLIRGATGWRIRSYLSGSAAG